MTVIKQFQPQMSDCKVSAPVIWTNNRCRLIVVADLMNHSVITGNLSQFLSPIAYLKANYPTIPFVLGEVGSSLNPSGNNYNLEGVLGSALWTVDFLLYSASIVSALFTPALLSLTGSRT